MRHLVLSGFMATGKTTLGPKVAARLGLPFVDTDEAVAAAAGRTIAEIWKSDGEVAFRKLEASVVEDLLSRPKPHVLAFGGGAVTTHALRRLAYERASVVTLDAAPEALLARIGDDSSRPKLAADDAGARMADLLRDRAEAYAESHARVRTDQLGVDEATEAIVRAHKRNAVLVALGTRSYTVDVVRGEPHRVTQALERLLATRVVVVTDAVVERARGAFLEAVLLPLEVPVHKVALPTGEIHKTLASVEVIWGAAIGAGADRGSVLLGVGGGVVGDLTGFAASTLFRGVRFVGAPTTLLAMVDAAVGGKTGFDLPSGKNLVGTIYQPSGVVCDVAHLETLSRRERTAGLAEIVKIALLADEELFDTLAAKAPRIVSGDVEVMMPIVRRAVELKARFVAEDERDKGVRTLLNLGHTVAHALEAHGGYSRFLHGEAVAIGMVIELAAAEKLGLTDGKARAALEPLLESLGLPTGVSSSDLAGAWSYTVQDKKRRGATLDWPLASRPGEARVVKISAEKLREAILGAP
jgi:shikimate kinase/3-dehydroquinate synthase